ncbi:MAG: HAMP domain-containing protein [Gammaproteobacteria bacterium]|nr:HAMP domain-containing protein [Gammaproteobacteria bacterium]
MIATGQKTPFRAPIKWVAVLGLGLLVAISLGSVLYIGFSVATKNTNELLTDKVESTLNAISSQVDKHLRPVEHQAVQIARSFESGDLTLEKKDRLQSYLLGFLSAAPQVSAIGFVKQDKRMIAITRQDMQLFEGPWPGRNSFSQVFQKVIIDKKSRWEPPVWSAKLEQSIATHYMPLYVDGQFVAILVQTVPISKLSRFLSDETYLHGVPFIYYDENKLIAHPMLVSWRPLDAVDGASIVTIPDIGEAVLEDLLAAKGFKPEILSDLKDTQSKFVEMGERDYLVFTRPITRYGEVPWMMGLYIDARAEGDTVRRLIRAFIAAVGFLILTLIVAMYGGVRVSRPIRSLASAMSQVRGNKIRDIADLPRNHISEFDEAAQSFNEMVDGLRERDLIRQTLGRYVPEKVAESLLKKDGALSTEETVATVLFADIEEFTNLTESLGPEGIVNLLNAYFSAMVNIIERYEGVVTQFQGDAILATFNVPLKNSQHAANALKAATEMRACFLTREFAGHNLRARIGVNTGHLIAGAVGAEGRLNYTVHGDAVNLAARIESLNKIYESYILTTQSTIDLTDGIIYNYVGETTVRGQTTPVKLYTLPEPEESE